MVPPAVPAALAALAAPAAVATAATGAGSEALHQLFADRWTWEMREFPATAMRLGDYSNASRLADESLEAIERRHQETLGHFARLREIDVRGLGEDDRVSAELFELSLRNEIADHDHRAFLYPLGARFGPHHDVPQMAEAVRFADAADYGKYLARLEQVPALVTSIIARLQTGLAEGRTVPAVTLAGLPAQLDALVDGDGLAALAAPLDLMPARLREGERQALRLRFERQSLPAVREAMADLRAFVSSTYLPGCRTTIAASSLPDGAAYYAHQLRKMTTTTMSAQEIHELGRAEVARIRAEMLGVIRRSDFLALHPECAASSDDALFAAFVAYLRTDPRFYHESEEALLTGYRDICKRIDAHLPRFFQTLPRLPYGVRKIPDFMAPQQTTAYYEYGSLANGEPGWFYANAFALDQRPTYEMIALAMHEAVPGHHLQTALAQEMTGVPEFRKMTWFTAFGEGWALYAERLGIEMGLYEDPYDDFGRLTYEMWRACRLVVDTGIHAMGWSRQEAVDFMLANSALTDINVGNEVDRYIAWPGQACAYKIGELRIRALRREAEQKLGRAFDLRAFHDVVLGAGGVPLDVLDRRVRSWIRAQPAGASYD